MMEVERRTYPILEFRANEDGEPKITGYAAVYNELSRDLGGFFEKIQPGAFASQLPSADVRALWNHNPDYPLGRTKSGTLQLAEDERGLSFAVTPPDTQYARDLLVSIRRGDVDQMSFGFRTVRDKWERRGGQVIRTLLEVELFDVSPVTYPAYPQTSAAVRSQLETFTASGLEPGADVSEKAAAQARNANRKRKIQILAIK